MPFRTMIPCGDPPLNPPEHPIEDIVECCVCEEEHDRIELINFGSEESPELVCLQITCLVDFINTLQAENDKLITQCATLADKIHDVMREMKHVL